MTASLLTGGEVTAMLIVLAALHAIALRDGYRSGYRHGYDDGWIKGVFALRDAVLTERKDKPHG